MLSAATGILRWHELEGRPEDLAFAESLYTQYRDLAMTETYENYNWFNRPEWTEACAVIDSFILAVNLWRTTGKPAYLEDAHLILFNGLLPGQTRDGGFGTGPCVGASGICRAKGHAEAPFCCSMRGGEGLARAIQYGYFLSSDAVTLAFYADSSAVLRFPDGICTVRQTTGYPHSCPVRLEFVSSEVSSAKRMRFFVPSWVVADSLRVMVNGTPVKPLREGAFAEISVVPAKGMVVELAFDQSSGPRPALNIARSPGAVRHFRGPLLLGTALEDGSEPRTPLLDILDPARESGGEPFVFFPKSGVTLNRATAQAADDCARLAQRFEHDSLPREVDPLLNELSIDRGLVICVLRWDEPQQVQQVILQWPDDGAVPAADTVLLRWSESGTIRTASPPGIIGNGRQWVYRVAQDGGAATLSNPVLSNPALSNPVLSNPVLSNLVLSLRSGTGTPSAFAVPRVRVPVAGH